MGHKISREQIDPGVKDFVMEPVGKLNELETNDKSKIVNAINSLIQDRIDNNENTTKIANSIGSPVTPGDNIDEIIGKVDELLLSFKSKIIGLGVVVENHDKFSELIEKLSSISQDGQSGIRYDSGTLSNYTAKQFVDLGYAYGFEVSGLSFKPNLVFGYCDKPTGTDSTNYVLYSVTTNLTGNTINCMATFGSSGTKSVYTDDQFITDDGFKMVMKNNSFQGNIKWYAFGVGEEDKTLENNLKSILLDKGVELNGTEEMIDLILKVDELWGDEEKQKLMDKLAEKGYEVKDTDSIDTMLGKIDEIEKNSGVRFNPHEAVTFTGLTITAKNLSHVMTEDKIYNIKDDNTIAIYTYSGSTATLYQTITRANSLKCFLFNVANGLIYAYDANASSIIAMDETTGEVKKSYTLSSYKNPVQVSNKLQRILLTNTDNVTVLDFDLQELFTINVTPTYCTFYVETGDIYIYTSTTNVDIYDNTGKFKDCFAITSEVQPNFVVIGHKIVMTLSKSKVSTGGSSSFNDPWMRIYDANKDTGMDRVNSGFGSQYMLNWNSPSYILMDPDRMSYIVYTKARTYDYSFETYDENTCSYKVDYLNGTVNLKTFGEDEYNNYVQTLASQAAFNRGSISAGFLKI